ncbi:uncharacterized protein LOC124359832 [Homalodisca vitripennis]|uniref:uncharacterized protein LOC124359832 n=1 Tax=Homalodisca vitripennis TaxID=197043 RepID=UPI001EEB7044|nr:uncharacterized protein LOC124359832 [Homalodisca vitripennis]
MFVARMSVFFFRLHNLRREEENKRRRNKSGTGCGMLRSNLTLAPSRLFERTPLTPSDSLDEIALKIPRVRVEYYVNENTFKERLQLYFHKKSTLQPSNSYCQPPLQVTDMCPVYPESGHRRRPYKCCLLLTCVLYILRVVTDDDPIHAACYMKPCVLYILKRLVTDDDPTNAA